MISGDTYHSQSAECLFEAGQKFIEKDVLDSLTLVSTLLICFNWSNDGPKRLDKTEGVPSFFLPLVLWMERQHQSNDNE